MAQQSTSELSRYFKENHDIAAKVVSNNQAIFISWVTDILIYLVVINLFAEFIPEHIKIESFWITLLVAVLFKILLEVLSRIEHLVEHSISSRGMETLAVVGTVVTLFVGKLAIIEIVNEVFDQVELHGFAYEAAMIITMILISIIVWNIFDRLGSPAQQAVATRKANTAAE